MEENLLPRVAYEDLLDPLKQLLAPRFHFPAPVRISAPTCHCHCIQSVSVLCFLRKSRVGLMFEFFHLHTPLLPVCLIATLACFSIVSIMAAMGIGQPDVSACAT
jgi:hypothetical protein